MNKVKIHINKEKRIITVAILGELNNEIFESHLYTIKQEFNKIFIKEQTMNFRDWKFNLYTHHMVIYKSDVIYIDRLFEYCKGLYFKQLDVITGKPQYKYRRWFNGLKEKHFANAHMKVFASNKLFKF